MHRVRLTRPEAHVSHAQHAPQKPLTLATPRALCIAGPTASGKSALALAIAQERAVEIISVDSALVFRGMNIGTAKPSALELASVPHHLIDTLEPTQSYSAADFVRDATRLVQEINARGRTALLVGGTMLYFHALLTGIDDMPAANLAIRAAIDSEAREKGWPAMHAELALVDAPSAARLSPNDSQRIQRALEVYRSSGKALSSYQTRLAPDATKNIANNQENTPALPLFSLEPASRAWLHERISQRFDAMLAAGFLSEVRSLMARGDLQPQMPSMRCVGYRQAWAHLCGETSFQSFREQGLAATRQLAKRQITWLRGMPQREVVACDASGAQTLALHTCLKLIDSQA
jgi:tRNA dimethylallyltransferase